MSELSHGERYTLRCMMPGVQRFLSGRGSKATDPENRYRCKPKEYLRMRDDYAGDVPISATDYERYQMGRDAWLFERDKQNGKTT